MERPSIVMTTSGDRSITPLRGRPPSTSHREIERIGLALFQSNGFDATTMDDIADALGVGRRTLFRYYPSKNDIVWGDFDLVLERLRRLLDQIPRDAPLLPSLSGAIVASNLYEPDQLAILRIRMTLITKVPALQAHAMLRYRSWRQVVAEFVAARRGENPDALIPQTVGFATLGLSMGAFSCWVDSADDDLDLNLERAFGILDGSMPLGPEGRNGDAMR
jgi:mycofactocin system transcriptional regulator